MSRIGKNPVTVPANVTVTINEQHVHVKGPKGELELNVNPLVSVKHEEGQLSVVRDSEARQKRAMQGLTRSLLQNMVTGVTEGFQKRLEINGVGYRAQVSGKKLVLSLGYSHPIEYPMPEGVEIKMDEEKKNVIVVSGIDKQRVGQAASEIRAFRKPEPYKGKGVKYEDEYIQRKAGKTAAKA